ncbi:7 transmembrane receptor [Onchocerca flexuosa]|uniref:7 transmembrane receptor n=2 Tax=Onchocerca flexuosa TaxID=387005 RepID=A0A183H7M0_9BILA|nr:7 transmembrane receptor [Onchocerca flexuosa]VDO36684.1 unnamed protein product [Onchocerca flexuosa]
MNIIIPEIFQNCSNEYRPKDIKYAQCNISMDADPCELLKELHKAKDIRTCVFAIIPLILATLAILINITYAILIRELWRRRKLGSSTCYSFLLSRTISNIIALLLLYIVLIAWKLEIFRYSSAAAFILIGSLSFLTLAGTYVAMTILFYIAIMHPLKYLYLVTVTRCFIVILILWLISIAFSLFVGLYGATLFYPETAPIYCSFDHCQLPIAIFIVSFLSIFFIAVIAFYLVMLYFIHNRNRDGLLETDIAGKVNVRTMNKLSCNMVTFIIGSLPIIIVVMIATINLKNFTVLGLGGKSPCKTFLHGRLFLQVEILAFIAAIVWMSAMIFDPIINFFSDPKFKNIVCSWRICQKQIPFTDFQNPVVTTAFSMRKD